jgi:hypothetical protein
VKDDVFPSSKLLNDRPWSKSWPGQSLVPGRRVASVINCVFHSNLMLAFPLFFVFNCIHKESKFLICKVSSDP